MSISGERISNWLNPRNERMSLDDNTSRWFALTVVWVQRAMIFLGLAFCASIPFRSHPYHDGRDYNWFWDAGVYITMTVLAALLTGLRAYSAKDKERIMWWFYSAAVSSYAIGNVFTIYNRKAFPWDSQPDLSLADVGFLVFYPLVYVAVVMMMKAQVRNVPRSVWIDGAVGVCACVALTVAFSWDVLTAIDKSVPWYTNAVWQAYPVGDLLVIGLLAGLLPMSAWRPAPVWTFVALGLLMTAVSDFWFAKIGGDYGPGTWHDIPWVLGWMCWGWASWRKTKVVDQNAFQSMSILAMPVFFALLALTVLAYGAFSHLAPAANILALSAVLIALVRISFTFKEIRSLAESRQQARTDELTELGNRRFFYEQTSGLLRNRKDEKPLSLLVVDLDRFKEINDSLGHQVGDNLLRQLGPRLQRTLAKDAIIARLGGDEFAIVLDNTNNDHALAAARMIVKAFEEPFVLDGVPVRISASVGIALFPDHARDANGLLQHADVAMYSSKREHSGPQVYLPERDGHTKERLRSIHELRRSIEQGRLVVYYQPQVDSRTGALIGSEALVRMKHPTQGIVPPDQFLPLAEQAGLMHALTSSVVNIVLDDMVRWREAGHPGLKVSINLSVTNLLDVNFAEDLAVKLAERSLDASQLVFEVTESTMLSDVERAKEAALRLQAMGAQISLDDYGTGYASLSYLREFPLNELKLDREFVAGLNTDQVARTFVRSAVEVAHVLGIRVVAEGIETRDIWSAVIASGSDVCQGYLFSKPMPADDFLTSVIQSDIRRLSAEPVV